MNNLQRCTQCILPETFPGIRFDQDGVCQYCRRQPDAAFRSKQKERLRVRFENLVEQVRKQPGYHCLVSLSGGKDSSFTLWLLRTKYQLRTLAFTFDNGFVPPETLKNLRLVTEHVGSDHIIVKPRADLLRRTFKRVLTCDCYPPRAMGRASGICNACISLAKGTAMRIALEKQVPMIAYGWTPGQIPLASAFYRTNRRMLRKMISAAMAPLEAAAGDEVAVYFPSESQIDNMTRAPYNVSPLAFLDYDEELILRSIDALAWARPRDTDSNSTNCLLNGFANSVHLEQMGFHPYVMDLSGLVREGYMKREEAIARLEAPARPEVMAAVQAKLGLFPQQLGRDRGFSTGPHPAYIKSD